MHCRQSKNDTHRRMPSHISVPVLIALSAGLFSAQAAMAQTRRFTATPLAPGQTTAAPKEAMVRSTKGASRGSESTAHLQKTPPQATSATGLCVM